MRSITTINSASGAAPASPEWGRSRLSAVYFGHRMDTQYIDHWPLRLDLKLITKTIPAVWRGVGAA
jgi:lipopolysaccharide/colanic/teichoic acid biosynthesis glycosyltransferase